MNSKVLWQIGIGAILGFFGGYVVGQIYGIFAGLGTGLLLVFLVCSPREAIPEIRRLARGMKEKWQATIATGQRIFQGVGNFRDSVVNMLERLGKPLICIAIGVAMATTLISIVYLTVQWPFSPWFAQDVVRCSGSILGELIGCTIFGCFLAFVGLFLFCYWLFGIDHLSQKKRIGIPTFFPIAQLVARRDPVFVSALSLDRPPRPNPTWQELSEVEVRGGVRLARLWELIEHVYFYGIYLPLTGFALLVPAVVLLTVDILLSLILALVSVKRISAGLGAIVGLIAEYLTRGEETSLQRLIAFALISALVGVGLHLLREALIRSAVKRGDIRAPQPA